MSAQIAKVFAPPQVAMPRGASWAVALVDALAGLGRATWRGLEAVGQARAQSELRRLAVMYAHRPELARSLREASQRDKLR